MEEIQFLNYLFSIGAIIISCIAIWQVMQIDKYMIDTKNEIKQLRNELVDMKTSKKKSTLLG